MTNSCPYQPLSPREVLSALEYIQDPDLENRGSSRSTNIRVSSTKYRAPVAPPKTCDGNKCPRCLDTFLSPPNKSKNKTTSDKHGRLFCCLKRSRHRMNKTWRDKIHRTRTRTAFAFGVRAVSKDESASVRHKETKNDTAFFSRVVYISISLIVRDYDLNY